MCNVTTTILPFQHCTNSAETVDVLDRLKGDLFINVDLKYVVLSVGLRNGCPDFHNEYRVDLCGGNNWYKQGF